MNAHTHSPLAPYKGITRSQPFEMWFADRAARQEGEPTPEELGAYALVTGLENLAAGNTAIIDHALVPQTKEHVYAIAEAYEALGIRAWVLVDATDLPRVCYTAEAYPRYPKAIPTTALPARMQRLVAPPRPYQEQLSVISEIIRDWRGTRVKLGLALSSPVWCSDGLLRDAVALAKEREVPIAVHAEESPVQREVSLAQWGMSGIRRLAEFGVLSERTLVAHVVQIDDADIRLLAEHRASVSHNPISNLKLQNGIAPVGKMLAAGVNVCLGTDGSSCADDQSLFPVLRVTAALGRLNGLQELGGVLEERVLQMATEHGYRLWFSGEASHDRVQFSAPVGPYAPIWSDLAPRIDEVYIDGTPVLRKARETVTRAGADAVIERLAGEALTEDRTALSEQFAAVTARYATAR